MANITVSQLHNAGSQLFQDSESFLNELGDMDSISALGGNYSFSNNSTFTKLLEGYVDVYAIGHITGIAKSFSKSGYF